MSMMHKDGINSETKVRQVMSTLKIHERFRHHNRSFNAVYGIKSGEYLIQLKYV